MSREKVVKIAPSIMAADYSRLGEVVREVEEGGADLLHFDIMDGNFVPNLTFGPDLVKSLRPLTVLPFEGHLMVRRPEQFFDLLAEAGVSRAIFHLEEVPFPHRAIEKIHKLGMKAAAALSPAMPLQAVEPLLPFLDFVVVMGVEPGFYGQGLIPHTLSKLEALRGRVEEEERELEIEFDGGVTEENITEIVKAGADIIVGGSSIFLGPRPSREMVARLKRMLTFLAG